MIKKRLGALKIEPRRSWALLAGVASLGLTRAWAVPALPDFPPHSYIYEWFLKPSPGEITFFLRYCLGSLPTLLLLSWGLSPWMEQGLARIGKSRFTLKRVLAVACPGVATLVAIIAWYVLRGRVVTDDEYVYLFQSRILLEGQAAMPAMPMSEFLANTFVVTRDGRWFGQYPPGHPLALVPGVALGVPRLVPIAFAVCNVLLFAAILRKIVGANWARAGVFLLCASPLFVLTGSTLLSHSTATLALSLAVLGALEVLQRDSIRWGALTGAGLGLALITRPWSAITLGLFPSLMLLWAVVARRRHRAIVPALLVAAACAAFFLVYNNEISGDPLITGYEAVRGKNLTEFGFGVIVPDRYEHTPLQGLENAGVLALRFLFWSWGWPLALLPCAFALRRRVADENPSGGPALLGERTIAFGALAMLSTGILSHIPYWSIGVNDTGPVKTYELLLPFSALTVLGARRWAMTRGRAQVGAFFVASCACALAVFWPPQIFHLRQVSARISEPLRVAETEAVPPALVFVSTVQRPSAASWVWGRPNPKPDLSDPILYVRDLGPKNLDYWRLHPERRAYRLVFDGEMFRLVPLGKDRR